MIRRCIKYYLFSVFYCATSLLVIVGSWAIKKTDTNDGRKDMKSILGNMDDKLLLDIKLSLNSSEHGESSENLLFAPDMERLSCCGKGCCAIFECYFFCEDL